MTRLLSCVGVLSAAGFAASAQQVFFDDFNGQTLPPQISGAGGLDLVQGWAGLGTGSNTFAGGWLRNATGIAPVMATSLTLVDLPAHDTLDIDFLLGIIDSWDGIGGAPGPDGFAVIVDGVTVFERIFAVQSGSSNYTPPAGGLLSSGTQLGYNGSYLDQAFDMSLESSLTVAHSAPTAVIQFVATGPGWQGGLDESWAIDNLRVTAIPAPGAIALLGLAGVAGRRRRA